MVIRVELANADSDKCRLDHVPIVEILKVGEIFQEVREQEINHREYQLSEQMKKRSTKVGQEEF